jgi:hypothetical protein
MLFKETVAVYYENPVEHTDTICGQKHIKAGGTYRIMVLPRNQDVR